MPAYQILFNKINRAINSVINNLIAIIIIVVANKLLINVNHGIPF